MVGPMEKAVEKTQMAFNSEKRRVERLGTRPGVGCLKCDGYGNRYDSAGNFAGLCECRNRPRVASFRRGYRESVRMANPAMVDQINLATEYFETTDRLISEWRKNHPATPSVLILGSPGTGKTMAAHIVAEKIIQRRLIPGFYLDSRDLALKIPRQVEDFKIKEFLDLANGWVGNPKSLLVLDQIGTEVSRESARVRVAEIMERRFDLGSRSIFVSGFSRGDLVKTYGETLFSRLFGGKWAWIFDANERGSK